MSISGARIEVLEDELSKLGDKQETHAVLMVGTNNVKSEGSEEILRKYENLITEAKKHKFRHISVVGILRRNDVSSFVNSRRIGVNIRLRELCERQGISYIYKELISEHLSRDKLHLSSFGQDEVGRTIFKHCKEYLN